MKVNNFEAAHGHALLFVMLFRLLAWEYVLKLVILIFMKWRINWHLHVFYRTNINHLPSFFLFFFYSSLPTLHFFFFPKYSFLLSTVCSSKRNQYPTLVFGLKCNNSLPSLVILARSIPCIIL